MMNHLSPQKTNMATDTHCFPRVILLEIRGISMLLSQCCRSITGDIGSRDASRLETVEIRKGKIRSNEKVETNMIFPGNVT